MVTRQIPGSHPSIAQQTLRAILSRNPALAPALEFLLDPAESLSVHRLRVPPFVATHRNRIGSEPFFLPRERFGGSQDLAMLPLIRGVVDETLRAYARTSPHLSQYIANTPISPYGSMGLSVVRWGQVDYDYVRDLDWRVYLPPEIGHLSGFKSELERGITAELHKYGIYPLMFGKDEHGMDQVQLRDLRTGGIHGFHFFLIAMKPGFARGNLHRDGAYSPHFAYFPEGSVNEHLESAGLLWPDLIHQQRQDYVDMFNQLGFNIFGENSGEDRLYKTRGWYLHKAFKWYATLARARGLESLEEDLLYQYEHFRGSEAELSYLARYRYYARMAPSRPRLDDVDRDLARALSIAYARARGSHDPYVGQPIAIDGTEILLLEEIPEEYAVAARRPLASVASSVPGPSGKHPAAGTIRFADNLAEPAGVLFDGNQPSALIPAEWSMIFCDSYVQRARKKAAEENQPVAEEDIRRALAAVLASLLALAAQAQHGSSGAFPEATVAR